MKSNVAGNENVEKAIDFISKETFWHVQKIHLHRSLFYDSDFFAAEAVAVVVVRLKLPNSVAAT